MKRTYKKNVDFKNLIFNLLLTGLEIKGGYKPYKPDDSIETKIDYMFHSAYDFRNSFQKDLKISFDWENTITLPDDVKHLRMEDVVGFHSIGDLNFLGILAGGDWEIPVFFILYQDLKNNIRAYIPTRGNLFDITEKCAYEDDESIIDDKDYDSGLIKSDIIKRFELEE
jgi:hypothetical protein